MQPIKKQEVAVTCKKSQSPSNVISSIKSIKWSSNVSVANEMRKFLLGYMSRTPFHCPEYLSITLLVSFLKSWTSWSWREKSACWLSLLQKSVLNFPCKKQQWGQGLRNISFQILVWEGQLYFPVPLHHLLTVCSLSASSHSKATFHLQYWEACMLCQFSSHENSDGVEVEQEGKGQSR